MKIGFITDTNILTKQLKNNKKDEDIRLWSEKNFLDKMDFFLNYIEDIEKLNNQVTLVYLMPETIIKELECQKIKAYNKAYKNFKKTYDKLQYGFTAQMPEKNIEQIVMEEENAYLDRVKILNIKYKAEIFEELVNEAINKLPPFDKSDEGQKSDSGFKDALIWKTILYSEEIDCFDKIYFFSGDNIFEDNSIDLSKQFEKIHKNTQLIIKYIQPDNERLQKCLKTIIDENKLPETDCVKLYNKEVILKFIKKLEYNFDKIVKLEHYVWEDKEILLECLLLRNFEEEDINIVDVKKEDNKFIVEVKFETKKYILHPKEALILPPRSVKGMIKLECQKKDKEIILKDYKIITVFFQKTLQEQAQEWSNRLSSITQSNEMFRTLESLRINVEPLQQMKQNLGIDLYNRLLQNTNDDTEDDEENDNNKDDNSDE